MDNKIYFCCSDIHSYCIPFKDALWKAGFRKTNKNHVLIVLGDLFDRGDDSLGIYNYIMSIPKARRVLIKGNHEQLLLDLLEKDVPDPFDFSNGTIKTLCHFANLNEHSFNAMRRGWRGLTFNERAEELVWLWRQTQLKVSAHPVIKWLKSDEWKYFYEVDKYIFVHSFIALNAHKSYKTMNPFYIPDDEFDYNPNWRTESTEKEWIDATWGCPYKKFDFGLFDEEMKNGKVLCVGHWHTGAFHENYEHRWNDNSIYFGKNLIALDTCTALTHKVNVLVIKNGICFDGSTGEQLNVKQRAYPTIETVLVEKKV